MLNVLIQTGLRKDRDLPQVPLFLDLVQGDAAREPIAKFMSQAVAIARKILNQPAFDDFNAGELSPGPEVSSEAEVLAWVARDAETALHPSCTARMGTDSGSALDPLSLRVHGVDGLRVVDASAMPYVTNGNIYAPVMMLAEKAADLVLGNTPLAREPIEFYRHRPA